jgi:hypothetical protein
MATVMQDADPTTLRRIAAALRGSAVNSTKPT